MNFIFEGITLAVSIADCPDMDIVDDRQLWEWLTEQLQEMDGKSEAQQKNPNNNESLTNDQKVALFITGSIAVGNKLLTDNDSSNKRF
jgi:hypothetical protein